MNYALEGYRFTNRISSVMAPNWAAKNAVSKFLTPQRLEIKKWEEEAEKLGVRFNLSAQVSAIRWSPDLALDEKTSEGRQILLVHGWESRATQMYGLVSGLVKQGYTVTAMDMPGHGHSTGKTSNAYLFAQTVRLAQQKLGHFHAIIGHSMGAGASAIAVGKGVKTDKLVLISGPSSIENVLRHFSSFVGLNKTTTNKFIAFIGQYVGVPAHELDSATLLEDSDIPTLLIHDESDIEVPISESKRLESVLNRSELFVTKGLGHRKILKSDDVLAKISAFVRDVC